MIFVCACRYIDEHQKEFIKTLGEAVAISNVSAWADSRGKCMEMVEWTNVRLKTLGFETTIRDVGTQELEGKTIPLPPVILASRGNDPNKNTLLIYGHLDVQPAKLVIMMI
jgi:Cys-Gly metallodipeptidase DUG1